MTTALPTDEIAHLDFDAPDPCEFDTDNGHCAETADYRVTIAVTAAAGTIEQGYCEAHTVGFVGHHAICEACGQLYQIVGVVRMMSAVIAEHDVTVLVGQAAEQLATLPAASVNCVVTSPPYFGLRDYGVEGQIGLEETPAEYVDSLRKVFAEVWRVLRDDGVLWLNLGDSYYSGRGNHGGFDPKQPARRGFTKVRSVDKGGAEWARPKNLLGIPWRVAFALQDDGWNLRNDIIWNKPNAMPDPVQDRLTCHHEHMFLLSKSRRYTFDLDAIKVPALGRVGGNTPETRAAHAAAVSDQKGGRRYGVNASSTLATTAFETKNPGDVWTMPPQPFPGAHFAVMPPEMARRCILAGCPAGGTVLDPFTGSGTTAMVARSLGRKSIGIELNPDYIPIIRQRIGQTPFEFEALA